MHTHRGGGGRHARPRWSAHATPALLKPSTPQTHTSSELRHARQRASLRVHNTTTQASQPLSCARTAAVGTHDHCGRHTRHGTRDNRRYAGLPRLARLVRVHAHSRNTARRRTRVSRPLSGCMSACALVLQTPRSRNVANSQGGVSERSTAHARCARQKNRNRLNSTRPPAARAAGRVSSC